MHTLFFYEIKRQRRGIVRALKEVPSKTRLAAVFSPSCSSSEKLSTTLATGQLISIKMEVLTVGSMEKGRRSNKISRG